MDNKMDQWHDGLLSDAEMLGWLLIEHGKLLNQMVEVYEAMRAAETRVAEERMKRLGV